MVKEGADTRHTSPPQIKSLWGLGGGLEAGVGGGGVFVAVWRMLSRSRRDGETLCESRADKGMQGDEMGLTVADKGGEKKGDTRGRKDEEGWVGHGPCVEAQEDGGETKHVSL